MTFRTLRLLTAAALGAIVMLAALLGFAPVLAQSDTPEFLVVHEVDATEEPG